MIARTRVDYTLDMLTSSHKLHNIFKFKELQDVELHHVPPEAEHANQLAVLFLVLGSAKTDEVRRRRMHFSGQNKLFTNLS